MHGNFSENITQRSTLVSTGRRKKLGPTGKVPRVSRTRISKQVKAVLQKSTKNYIHKVLSRILYTLNTVNVKNFRCK